MSPFLRKSQPQPLGPNRVVSPSPLLKTETDRVSRTLCFIIFGIPDNGKSPQISDSEQTEFVLLGQTVRQVMCIDILQPLGWGFINQNGYSSWTVHPVSSSGSVLVLLFWSIRIWGTYFGCILDRWRMLSSARAESDARRCALDVFPNMELVHV
jgi:hypothetical protein